MLAFGVVRPAAGQSVAGNGRGGARRGYRAATSGRSMTRASERRPSADRAPTAGPGLEEGRDLRQGAGLDRPRMPPLGRFRGTRAAQAPSPAGRLGLGTLPVARQACLAAGAAWETADETRLDRHRPHPLGRAALPAAIRRGARGGEVRRPCHGRRRGAGAVRARHRADEAVQRASDHRARRRSADRGDAQAARDPLGIRRRAARHRRGHRSSPR